jgi:hypothetical protein
MRLLLVFFILMTIFFCCSCSYSEKYFTFNAIERDFLNAFKRDDTLSYESSSKQVEKMIVLGMDSSAKRAPGYLMAPRAFNEVCISIKQLPVESFQPVSQNVRTWNSDKQQLLCITKNPQAKETIYSIQFKDLFFYSKNGLGKPYRDTTINGRKFTNYYVIYSNLGVEDTASANIEKLYWTCTEGLVAYKQKNGAYWVRKSN